MNPRERNDASILPVFRSREETRAYYNKISKVYDFLSDHSEKPVREAGIDMLAPQSGEKILEIGFGTGHGLLALASAVAPDGRIYGIDLSGEMLVLSQRLLSWAGLSDFVELVCDDATQLPYPDDMMEAVFISFTLELFDKEDIQTVLHECKRVLVPGGRIVVVGLSKEGNSSGRVKAYEWTHRHFPNLLDCRPIFVHRSLREAGFRVEQIRKMKVWLPVEVVLAIKPSRN